MRFWETTCSILLIGFLLPLPSLLILQISCPAYAQTKQNQKAEADRLLFEGVQQAQANQYEAALKSWEQALTLYRRLQDRDGEGNVLVSLGNAYQQLSQYDKAITYYQQLLPIYQQNQDHAAEGLTLANLGFSYNFLSQYDKAIAYLQQSVKVWESIRAQTRPLPKDNAFDAFYVELISPTYQALAELLKKQGRDSEAQQVLNLLKVQ